MASKNVLPDAGKPLAFRGLDWIRHRVIAVLVCHGRCGNPEQQIGQSLPG